MEQVSIPLNEETASLYLRASNEKKKKAEFLVNLYLKNIFKSRKTSIKKLFESMEMAGRMAQANGLTREILEEILNEKD